MRDAVAEVRAHTPDISCRAIAAGHKGIGHALAGGRGFNGLPPDTQPPHRGESVSPLLRPDPCSWLPADEVASLGKSVFRVRRCDTRLRGSLHVSGRFVV